MTMKEDQQQQPGQAQAQASSPYVAVKPLKFGTQLIEAGQPVPLQPGRNYQLMLQRGEIAPALSSPTTASTLAAAQVLGAQLSSGTQPRASSTAQHLTLSKGPAFFVGQDGAHSEVMVLSFKPADPADAEALGIAPGSPVAEVDFSGDSPEESPSVVPLSSLLPYQPTVRLLSDLQGLESSGSLALEAADWGFEPDAAVYVVTADGQVTEGKVSGLERVTPESTELLAAGFSVGELAVSVEHDGQTQRYGLAELVPQDLTDKVLSALGGDQQAEVERLKKELAFSKLLIEAMQLEGTELPEDLPSRATVLKAGVKTIEGLVLLAAGPEGLSHLDQLDGIALKSGQKLIDYLVSKKLMLEPDAAGA